MLNFLGVLSQWERENIIERTTFGKRKKAQMGEWGGGTPPVGYTLEVIASDKEGKARTICRMVRTRRFSSRHAASGGSTTFTSLLPD